MDAIKITAKAAEELKRIRVENKIPEEAYLRIGLKGGGCSGFTYTLGFTDKLMDGDESFESRGLKVLINRRALPYLSGLELDFNEDPFNRKFVFGNPNAEQTCGCGESFKAREETSNEKLSRPEKATVAISEEEILKTLRECYDPEIPVNVVDLGLIYKVEIDGNLVRVEMTLTTPGCGMGPIIANQVRMKLLDLPGVVDVKVKVVFDPPWDSSKMSEAAKKILNIE